VCVPGDQWVEGPLDAADAERSDAGALQLLEVPADTVVAQVVPHREHVGPMGRLTVAQPREAEYEPDQIPARVERTQQDPAQLLRHQQEGWRDELAEVVSPRDALQRHAPLVVLVADEFAVPVEIGFVHGVSIRCLAVVSIRGLH
jgi:hypothetical protein